MSKAIVRAHPNIALAKYWGKAAEGVNAPAVPSLSVTLSGMETRTELTFDSSLHADSIELNGGPADARTLARTVGLLDRVRSKANLTTFARIVTENSFPTAAGLASSASGFAALALAATRAAGLSDDLATVSDLARRSSASSARSIFGGFVELQAGTQADVLLPARPIAAAEHLPLRLLVAVSTEQAKPVSSTEGMNHTTRSSPYYTAWVSHAHTLFAHIKDAVLRRDLEALGEAAEASALAMHACALAARPGVLYWNGVTVLALHAVRELRAHGVGAWATIDAGPHLKAICAPSDAQRVRSTLEGVPGVLRVLETQPGPGASCIVEPC